MLTTFELLTAWSKLQPNRCKHLPEVGANAFVIYLDGHHHMIKVLPSDPSLNGIDQALLVRALHQSILGSHEYSIKTETVRKHRTLYGVWISHDEIDATGYAEEPDVSDALLRAYIQAQEMASIKWEEDEIEKGSIFGDEPVSIPASAFGKPVPTTATPKSIFLDCNVDTERWSA